MLRLFCCWAILCPLLSLSQSVPISSDTVTFSGKIISADQSPIMGADLLMIKNKWHTTSNVEGGFRISATNKALPDTLIISHINFITRKIPVSNLSFQQIILEPKNTQLQEVVVNTGYQSLSRKSTTGSFVQIDNAILNRRISPDLLGRLEGTAAGLVFQKPINATGSLPPNEKLGISIRGRSTIDEKVSADPLVVVDNFPYDGNINNINPNDIESVTILKDAAAAAIWGSRSANGVIVITTKKASFNQPLKVEFNTNLTSVAKPDLFYSKRNLSSSDFIGVETLLFNKGFFDADLSNTTNRPPVSPVVEILARQRAGQISVTDAAAQLQTLAANDVRNDFNKYVYQPGFLQQYALNLKGGSAQARYSLSMSYDQSRDKLIGNGNNRITIHSVNSFIPAKNIELSLGLLYTLTRTQLNNANGLGNISMGGTSYAGIYPYASLADGSGNSLPITKDYRAAYVDSVQKLGFLDWRYRPLDEIQLADNTAKLSDLLINASLTYRISPFLKASLQYQNERQSNNARNYYSLQTYYARNLVNRFSNRNASTGVFTYPLPKGGILNLGNSELVSDNLRAQLDFTKSFAGSHSVSAIAGAEIKQSNTTGFNRNSYGYDDNFGTAIYNLNFASSVPVNPTGSATLSAPDGSVTGNTNRFISYYANAAYTYKNKYSFSLSGRQDGANIFGVNANDKITPLWSAGIAWELSHEAFYHVAWLPYLKIRISNGYNGNIYNASAYLTAVYRTSNLTGLPYASVSSPPNPDLRWERVNNQNIGIDFETKKRTVWGTIELYRKNADDLIEAAPLAPSTGFTSFKGNAASLKTEGFDITLNTRIIQSRNQNGLTWDAMLIISKATDKVTRFDTRYLASSLAEANPTPGLPAASGVYAVEGNSLFGIYSYRWAGLDPATGDPQGILNGQISKDYLGIINAASLDNIVYIGPSRPAWTGSWRNTITWKNWSFSINLLGKFGYYFRNRSTPLNYQNVLQFAYADYANRWQNPGDEALTNIPSLVYPSNNNRNTFYQNAEILVQKADQIRLQDCYLSYQLQLSKWKGSPFQKAEIYGNASNLGIIWRANKSGLDPDAIDNQFTYAYPAALSIAAGIKITFK